MNVSQENTSKVAAVVKVGIVKADYEEKVEKALRTYRQKANIPGFRKGMAPMGGDKENGGEIDPARRDKQTSFGKSL